MFLLGEEKSIIILNELAFASFILDISFNIVEFKVCAPPGISLDISFKNLGINKPSAEKEECLILLSLPHLHLLTSEPYSSLSFRRLLVSDFFDSCAHVSILLECFMSHHLPAFPRFLRTFSKNRGLIVLV